MFLLLLWYVLVLGVLVFFSEVSKLLFLSKTEFLLGSWPVFFLFLCSSGVVPSFGVFVVLLSCFQTVAY